MKPQQQPRVKRLPYLMQHKTLYVRLILLGIFAQFIALCSSLKHLIHGWKYFCRAVEEYVHSIELYSLILSTQVI